MTDTNRYIELEGRINAHRCMLEVLLRQAAQAAGDTDGFWRQFEDYTTVKNHQEDPGVLPDEAYATMVATIQEITSMVREARANGG